MFIVNNLQSDYKDIYVGDEFVESLHDTLKIRAKFLSELVSEIDEILNPRETFEEWMAKQKSPQQVEDVYGKGLAVCLPFPLGRSFSRDGKQSFNCHLLNAH